jgi:dTDP-4-amino-4,6-dideoxygalactose transaminase
MQNILKKIPYWEPVIDNYDYKKLNLIFKNNFVNQGPVSNSFEDKIKKLFNIKYSKTTNNCTTAIFLALKAINLKHNDEVVIPNITWIAVANAVKLTDAKVVLCDVSEKDYNLDFESLKKSINKKTKAVIYVHNSGRSGDIKKISSYLKKKNIILIEDAAEAFYSKSNNIFLGTYGDFGCYSFTPNKLITCGQGGMLVCKNKKFYNFIKNFKNQGIDGHVFKGNNKIQFPGFNFKFSDLQASLCLSQMKKIKKRIFRLKRNYKLYLKNLKNITHTQIIKTNVDNGNVPLWVYCISEKKKEIISLFKKNNIGYRDYWLPISSQNGYKTKKIFNVSENQVNKLFWLPSSYTLKDNDVIKVCKLIKNL